jgi:UDP-N-acetylmuramoylalanine--D-glutamate ligase
MSINFKKALVVGLGYRTGLSAANFLAQRGVDVTVSDSKSSDELREIIEKLNPAVKIIAGVQDPRILDNGFDTLVLSPGVPAAIPLVQEALKRGIPVISEIELAYRNMKGHIIAITGTDGKSTTTELTGHIFKKLGFKTLVGGNIGIPLISLAEKTDDNSVTVVELSSFQLETIDSFKPHVSAILNVTPDHLDRYNSIASYYEAKKRIFMNYGEDEYFIYNRESDVLNADASAFPVKSLCFSSSGNRADSFYKEGKIFLNKEGKPVPVIEESKMQILGIHNVENSMAALLMTLSLLEMKGIAPDLKAISEACYSFKSLEHRMEFAGEFHGRIFINDSKATTIGAVGMAVKSIRNSGVLILGGRTKGDDYSRLRSIAGEKVRAIVLIGESSDEFEKIFHGLNTVKAVTIDDAVAKSMQLSQEGDMILLSPACASFDMFKSFDERGKVFKDSVKKLIEGKISWI